MLGVLGQQLANIGQQNCFRLQALLTLLHVAACCWELLRNV